MAWLIRDNRHLLPTVQNGECGDESSFLYASFDELDPNPYNDNCLPTQSSTATTTLIDEKGKIGGRTKEYCAQNDSPCSCGFVLNSLSVECYGISVESVRDEFQRLNDPNIYYLAGYLSSDDATISLPTDFLGNTSVTGGIYISHSIDDVKYPNLVINPLAFRASQKSLSREFKVSNVDFGLQKDFNFLNGFDKLEELYISSIQNLIAFQYFPPLPSLQWLYIWNCPDVNEITFPDLSPAKLKNLELRGSGINDQKADEIVAKLAASTSADSLEVLDLSLNSLMRIPSQLGTTFPKLKEVQLGINKISHIPSSSLTFASPYLEILDLYENGIKTIESGAFVGINRLLSEQKRIILHVLLFL